MLRSLPTPALFALAALLAAGNALVGTPLAHAEGDEVLVEPMPMNLPSRAFFGVRGGHRINVDGVDVTLERTDDGHLAMVFTNPGATDVEVNQAAVVTRTNNQPMGRMGPIPIEVARVDDLSMSVPAGASKRFVFAEIEVPEPPAPAETEEEQQLMFLAATTTFDVTVGDQVVGLHDAEPADVVADLFDGSN